jgi:hypothetical protein
MASKENAVALVDPHQLASVIRSSRLDKVSIIGINLKEGEIKTFWQNCLEGGNVSHLINAKSNFCRC